MPGCPGPLVEPAAIEGDFLLRMRMRVRSSELDISFELAVQKRDEELVLVGFDPLGAVAFQLVQRADGVEVERRLPRAALPVPPMNVLYDLHRARFVDGIHRELDNRRCGYRVSLIELSRQDLR